MHGGVAGRCGWSGKRLLVLKDSLPNYVPVSLSDVNVQAGDGGCDGRDGWSPTPALTLARGNGVRAGCGRVALGLVEPAFSGGILRK